MSWRYENLTFPLRALTLLAGWQEKHPAGKKLGAGLLMVTISLEIFRSYNSTDIILSSNKVTVLANQSPPGKMANKMETELLTLFCM